MKYMIMGLFSLLAVTTYAQVRGTVKDNTGENPFRVLMYSG